MPVCMSFNRLPRNWNILRLLYASYCVLLASSCNGWAGRAIVRIFSARPNQIILHTHTTLLDRQATDLHVLKKSLKKIEDCSQIEYDFPLIQIVNDFQSSGAEALPSLMLKNCTTGSYVAACIPVLCFRRCF